MGEVVSYIHFGMQRALDDQQRREHRLLWGRSDEPATVIILPIIRVERYDGDQPGRGRRRRRNLKKPSEISR